MSRVIHVESIGKDRGRLTKVIVLALRELARQPGVGTEALDLSAFIALSLQHIADGIDPSVSAWEKRGYWVKADRFRMEWAWAGDTAHKLKIAVLAEDWSVVATLAAQTGQRLGSVKVPARPKTARPWTGAYARLRAN